MIFMFSFWVKETTIFSVTQAWHLHTMPALIILKYNFDYFTPFKNILCQFLCLESKLPWPLILTSFCPFFQRVPYASVRAWLLWSLWAEFTVPGTMLKVSPHASICLSQLIWKENSCGNHFSSLASLISISHSFPPLISGIEIIGSFTFCIWIHFIFCCCCCWFCKESGHCKAILFHRVK